MSLKYMNMFLRYGQKFIDPYIMEFYTKCCDVNVNSDRHRREFTFKLLAGEFRNVEMSSPKSMIKVCGLRHDKNGCLCK